MINFLSIKGHAPNFRSGLKWNLIGFLIIAGCGLLINLLITYYYGFSILGYFNLLLMFYLVLPQFCSWGIPLSVQKFTPQFSQQKNFLGQLVTSALIISIVLAATGVAAFLLMADLPGRLMDNHLLREGFPYIVPGIGFAVVNKVFLSFLNGMRFMKSFAFYNALRTVLMLLCLVLFIAFKINIKLLGLIFTLPEFTLMLLTGAATKDWLVPIKPARFLFLVKLHLCFGNKGLIGSIVTSLHPKIDVFILGFFASNTLIGVYSFAAMVADGFFQIFYVFRAFVNPIVTEVHYNRSSGLLRRIIESSVKKLYGLFLILGLILALAYPGVLYILDVSEYWVTNLLLFYILLCGILISSGYAPFQFFFNQVGQPGAQSRFFVTYFLVTTLLILIMVPALGVVGAAIALFFSNIYQLVYLKIAIQRHLEKPSG